MAFCNMTPPGKSFYLYAFSIAEELLVVLISLVVIYKKQVTQIVKDILSKAASDAKGI